MNLPDNLGTAASLTCAVHCALMPFVVTLLPLAGMGFLAHESTEWTLLALSATLGIGSLCWGYRTHKSRRALSVLASGLLLLVIGRLLEERGSEWFGMLLVVSGGISVAAAHWVNKRLCRACHVCHPTTKEKHI